MRNFQKIIRTAYLRLLGAGLQEDMAQRIMYSVLPHLADPSQVALTGGVVDPTALKAAVEGRKNLIQYGVEAVLQELNHYDDGPQGGEHGSRYQSHPWTQAVSLIKAGKTEEFLDLAVEAFRDSTKWDHRYGGRAWEMIAKTLRQIVRLDKQLHVLRRQSPSAERQEKEIQVMKDLVIEMNVFDGLAHNSDNILSNLVEIEHKLNNDRGTKRDSYRRIKRLMDAKELDSPVEVYKLIQDTLTNSGDAIKFKEWVSKMRRREEYFKSDPKLYNKLFLIHLRKAVMPARSEMNHLRDIASNKIKTLESSWDEETYTDLLSAVSEASSGVKIVTGEFQEHLNEFITQYPELPDAGESAVPIISSLMDKGLQIFRNLERRLEILGNRFSTPSSPDDQQKALTLCKDSISLLNSFSYMLDAI